MKGCVSRMWVLMNCRAKWIFTTPDKTTTQDSPLSIPLAGEIGEARRGKKIQWSKWRDKSESETVLIMEAGLNVTGWEQSPLNLWYPYMTDEMVWNTGAASCHPLVNTFCHELVLHKQPFWVAVDPCKVLKIFSSLRPQTTGIMMLVKDRWRGLAPGQGQLWDPIIRAI